jgi:hypothetical protein
MKGVERVHTQYCINVDLKLIVAHDNAEQEADDWDGVLSTRLDRIEGVFDTNYNGHFGNYIWVTIATEHDNLATWKEIERRISLCQ